MPVWGFIWHIFFLMLQQPDQNKKLKHQARYTLSKRLAVKKKERKDNDAVFTELGFSWKWQHDFQRLQHNVCNTRDNVQVVKQAGIIWQQ